MLTRRHLLQQGLRITAASQVALLSAPLAGCVPRNHALSGLSSLSQTEITGPRSLKAHASASHLFAGAAVDVTVLQNDPMYRLVLAEQFNMVVAEREMKWKTLRPAPDRYTFTLADTLMTFARRHKMKVRGHNFVWHEALPDWFASTVTKSNARQFLVDHIMTVGQRYQGKIHSWDVVNEAVLPSDGRTDGLRKSPWLDLLGPSYLETAFRTAREADPHALLTYNDYGVEYDNTEDDQRRFYILQLLQRLKSTGVPLDAVGIQAHIKAVAKDSIGKGLRDFMSAIRAMGLKIFVTELDVNEDDIATNDVTVRDKIIADTYTQFLSVAMQEPALKAVLTWGVNDAHTWLNNGPTHKKKQPDRPQRSLPFDNDDQPKPAYFALRESFDRRVPS